MRSSSDDSAVRKITGRSPISGRARSARTRAQPSMRGIITSVMSRSGGVFTARVYASSPSVAVSTT
jgi:hypothetical protein